MSENHLNIIYLTTDCNLKCTYCYEKNKHPIIKRITYDEIDLFLENIVRSLPISTDSVVCVMGGEPFLEMDKYEYLIRQAYEYQKKLNKSIAFNTITNGTLLKKNIKKLKELFKIPICQTIDISYDRRTNYLRTKYKNFENIFEELLKNEIPFGLSYTVTDKNADINWIVEDLEYLIEKFIYPFPFQKDSRMRVNFAIALMEKMNIDTQNFMKQMKKESIKLFSKYGISICQLSCNLCKKCSFEYFADYQYTVPGKTEKIMVPRAGHNKLFNHF